MQRYVSHGLFVVMLLMAVATHGLAAEDREADHRALRQLLAGATEDLNARNTQALATLFDATCSLTFVDQTQVHDGASLDRAFAKWFGPDSPIATVRFQPKVEQGAIFTGPDTGWITGVSDDVYTLKDGRTGTMPVHWTATVVRRAGGWRISTLHVGVDPQHNLILAAAIATARRTAIIAASAALVVGFLIGWLIARRRA